MEMFYLFYLLDLSFYKRDRLHESFFIIQYRSTKFMVIDYL